MIDRFIDSVKARGLRPATIEQYVRNMKQFEQWLSTQNLSLFTADQDDITGYYTTVAQESHAPSTIHHKTQTVFAFYQWLVAEGCILVSPAPKGIPYKGGALPRNVPVTSDIQKIVKMYYLLQNPYEQRTIMMIDLIYSCGIRREELQRLNIVDIDFQNGMIHVLGKGDKHRKVPVGIQTIKRLWHYLYENRTAHVTECRTNALFISCHRAGIATRVNKQAINYAVSVFRKKYGFTESVTPHALRHAFATDLLRAGAPLEDISQMLGHEHLVTTVIYTRLHPDEVKRHHQKYHPRG